MSIVISIVSHYFFSIEINNTVFLIVFLFFIFSRVNAQCFHPFFNTSCQPVSTLYKGLEEEKTTDGFATKTLH